MGWWRRTVENPPQGAPDGGYTQLLLLADALPVMVSYIDGQQRYRFVNKTYEQWFAVPREAIVGRTIREHLGEAVYADRRSRVQAALSGERQRFLGRMPRGDGAVRDVEIDYLPARDFQGTVHGFYVLVTDVTERRCSEELLRQSQARQAFLLRLGDALRALADPVEIMRTAAEALGRELGIARVGYGEVDTTEELVIVDRDWTDGTVGSVAGRHRMNDFGPPIIEELKAGRIMSVDDVAVDARVGPSAAAFAVIETRSVLAVPLIKNGQFTAMLFFHHPEPHAWTDDERTLANEVGERTWAAVERARAEARLRESEDHYRHSVELNPQTAWTSGPDGQLDHVSRRWFEWTGTSGLGSTWAEGLHEEDRARTFEAWGRSVATGEPYDVEHRVKMRDGSYRWMHSRAYPRRDDSGAVVKWYGTTEDIHERRVAEEELRQESRTLVTLNYTGAAVASELDLEKVVQLVTDAGVELTGARFGAFFYNVLNEAGESYMLYTLSGGERSAFEGFGMPRNTAVFHPTFSGEGVMRSDDITADRRYGLSGPHHGMPKGHPPVKSYLAVPVITRSGEVVGGLFFGHPDAAMFDERDEQLIVGLAGQAAIAIDNARLYQAAQRELRERREAEAALRESEEHMRLALSAGQLGDWSWDAASDKVDLSKRGAEIFGVPPGPHLTWRELQALLHPEDAARAASAVEAAMRSGDDYGVEYRVRRPDNGVQVWVAARGRPILGEDGAPTGMIGVVQDVTARHRAEEHLQLMINELNHRVKNTLAIVQAIAHQTLRGATAESRAALDGRLMALSSAHNLLTRETWEAADLSGVVNEALDACNGESGRFHCEGPHVRLEPKTAVTIAMALHELCTNATKYGALSNAEGRVSVTWRVEPDGEPRLRLTWRESGGPPVSPPERRGFGSRMIERALAAELQGQVRLDFRPEGLVCEIDAPLPRPAADAPKEPWRA